MSADMMVNMPPEAMAAMSPEMMANMPPEAMQGMDADMMAAMPPVRYGCRYDGCSSTRSSCGDGYDT